MKTNVKSILTTILLIAILAIMISLGTMLSLSIEPAKANSGHTHKVCCTEDCTHSPSHQDAEFLPMVTTGGEFGSDDASYYLDQDITLVDSITFREGNINICLNGHTLDLNGFTLNVFGGTLNICNCAITGMNPGQIISSSGTAILVGSSNASDMDGDSYCNIYSGVVIDCATAFKVAGTYNGEGHLTINGGTITSDGMTIWGTGTYGYVTINDGYLTSEDGIAIKMYNNLTINGGTIVAKNEAIYLESLREEYTVNININGGDITGKSALYVNNEITTSDPNNRKVNITGGKLSNIAGINSAIKINRGYVYITKAEINAEVSSSASQNDDVAGISVSSEGYLTIAPNSNQDVDIKSERYGISIGNLSGQGAGGYVTINGCVVDSNKAAININSMCSANSIVINGGTYTSDMATALIGGHTTINGGSFSTTNSSNTVLASYRFLTLNGSPQFNGDVYFYTIGMYTENTPNRSYIDMSGYTGEVIKLASTYNSVVQDGLLCVGNATKLNWTDEEYALDNIYDQALGLDVIVFKHTAHTGGDAPTCTQKSICTVCATEYGDLVAHTELTPATCTSKATCSVCTQEYGETLPHNYTEQQKDDTHHWEKCADCDATNTKIAHSYGEFGDFVDNGDGTKTKTATCTVCSKQVGVTVKIEVAESNKSLEQESLERGTTLEMNVVQDETQIKEETKAPIKEEVAETKVIAFIDITITDIIKELAISNTNNVLEIPVAFATADKSNIEIYRNHNGVVTKFTLLTSRPTADFADATYYVGDGVIYIYTSQFSTYAVAYDDATVNTTPDNTTPDIDTTPDTSTTALSEEAVAGIVSGGIVVVLMFGFMICLVYTIIIKKKQ